MFGSDRKIVGNDTRRNGYPVFVRVYVIVGSRRKVDEQRIGGTYVLNGVRDTDRKGDEGSIPFREEELVDHSVRGTLLAQIEEHDPEVSAGNEDPVHLFLVVDPTLDFPGTYRRHVGVHQRFGGDSPSGIKDLAEFPAIVRMGDGFPDFNAGYDAADAFSTGSHCLSVFCSGKGGSFCHR